MKAMITKWPSLAGKVPTMMRQAVRELLEENPDFVASIKNVTGEQVVTAMNAAFRKNIKRVEELFERIAKREVSEAPAETLAPALEEALEAARVRGPATAPARTVVTTGMPSVTKVPSVARSEALERALAARRPTPGGPVRTLEPRELGPRIEFGKPVRPAKLKPVPREAEQIPLTPKAGERIEDAAVRVASERTFASRAATDVPTPAAPPPNTVTTDMTVAAIELGRRPNAGINIGGVVTRTRSKVPLNKLGVEKSASEQFMDDSIKEVREELMSFYDGSLQKRLLEIAGRKGIRPTAEFMGIVNTRFPIEVQRFIKRVLSRKGPQSIDSAIREASEALPGARYTTHDGVTLVITSEDAFMAALRDEIAAGISGKPSGDTLIKYARATKPGFIEAERVATSEAFGPALPRPGTFDGAEGAASLGAAKAGPLPAARKPVGIPGTSAPMPFEKEAMIAGRQVVTPKPTRVPTRIEEILTPQEIHFIDNAGLKADVVTEMKAALLDQSKIKEMPLWMLTAMRERWAVMESHGVGFVQRGMVEGHRGIERGRLEFEYIFKSAATARNTPTSAQDIAIGRWLEGRRDKEVMDLLNPNALAHAEDIRVGWETWRRIVGLPQERSVMNYRTRILLKARNADDIPTDFLATLKDEVVRFTEEGILDVPWLQSRVRDLGEAAYMPGAIGPFSAYMDGMLKYVHLRKPMQALNMVLRKVNWTGKENTKRFLRNYYDAQLMRADWLEKEVLGPMAKSFAKRAEGFVTPFQKLGLTKEASKTLVKGLQDFQEMPVFMQGRIGFNAQRSGIYMSTVGTNPFVLLQNALESSKLFAEVGMVHTGVGVVDFARAMLGASGKGGTRATALWLELRNSVVLSSANYRAIIQKGSSNTMFGSQMRSYFGNKAMSVFTAIEFLMRGPAYFAGKSFQAVRLARAQRLGISTQGMMSAEDFGVQTANRVFQEYNLASIPEMFTGSSGKMIGQLGQWFPRHLEWLSPIQTMKDTVRPWTWFHKDPLAWGGWSFNQNMKRIARLQVAQYALLELGHHLGVDLGRHVSGMFPVWNRHTKEWNFGWALPLPWSPNLSSYSMLQNVMRGDKGAIRMLNTLLPSPFGVPVGLAVPFVPFGVLAKRAGRAGAKLVKGETKPAEFIRETLTLPAPKKEKRPRPVL